MIMIYRQIKTPKIELIQNYYDNHRTCYSNLQITSVHLKFRFNLFLF